MCKGLNLYKNQDWDSQLKIFINGINVRSKPSIKPVQIALENGTSPFDIIDYVDGSEVFNKFAESEGKKDKKYEFMKELINTIPNNEVFTKFFPELNFLNG